MENREVHYVLASIVLVTPRNTPEAFREEWLDQHEVFDEEMEIEQALKAPPITKIQYENGFVYEVHKNPSSEDGQGRTEIKFPFGDESPEDRQSKLDDLKRYCLNFAEATRHLPYGAVGINFKVAIEDVDLDNVTTGLPDGAQAQQLSFVLLYGDFKTKVQLDTGSLADTGTPVLVFSGNFHKNLPEFENRDDRYEEIEETIQEMPNTLSKLEEIIDDTDL
jgi:hypothetical protein